jgi:CTP synthase (UTP-ammonia lyase)
MKLAIIGDFRPDNLTHTGTDLALQQAAQKAGIPLDPEWIPTDKINERFDGIVTDYDGFLIAPGSPYADMKAVLRIIRYARENSKPTLGTCGGFQHMVIEFARNVLRIADAEHAEHDPYASRLVINPLSCNLKGDPLEITITEEDTLVFRVCGTHRLTGRYYCNFGLNTDYQQQIDDTGFRVVGIDATKEARILELEGHPFYVATLFIPQMNSTADRPHPLITAFLRAGNQRR